MTKLSFDKIDSICEAAQLKLYDYALKVKASNFEELLHVISSHTFNDLRSDLIEYMESNGIEVK